MTTATVPQRFSLDPLQRAASRAPEGPILVIGGAGTGKTRTLMGRVAALIQGGAPPFTVTYLTFNARSADNARQILSDLPINPDGHKAIFVGTLHSYASHFLRQAGAASLGLSPNYTIWDNTDTSKVLNDILSTAPKPDPEHPDVNPVPRLGDIPQIMAWHTFNQARLPEDSIPPPSATWLNLIDLYTTEKRRQHTIDLDDLIPLAVKSMETDQTLRHTWARIRSRHLLVDEFQDLTPIQYRMIQLMLGPTKSITIATDPNQNIYAWRGSNSGLLGQFRLDHPNVDNHILKLNHRSTITLTNAASNLTDAPEMNGLFNAFQTGARPKGPSPTLRQFRGNQADMYHQILLDLQEQHDSGIPWENMACLYRWRTSFSRILAPLNLLRIPFTVLGNTDNLKDAKTKKLVNLLNCLVNPLDTKSFSIAAETVSNDGKRRLNSQVVSSINRIARDSDLNLIEASKIYRAANRQQSHLCKNLSGFIDAWEDLNQILQKPDTNLQKLCRRANTLVHESDNYGVLRNPQPEFTKVLTLSETTPRFDNETPQQHLSRFLELLATAPDPETPVHGQRRPFHPQKGPHLCNHPRRQGPSMGSRVHPRRHRLQHPGLKSRRRGSPPGRTTNILRRLHQAYRPALLLLSPLNRPNQVHQRHGQRHHERGRRRSPPDTNTQNKQTMKNATRAKITKIIDGDTIDIAAPGGLLRSTKQERLRLYGIDAPESNQRGGTDATKYLAKMARPGKKIWVHRTGTDQYGRTIALISPNRSRVQDSFNYRMIRAGHARAYMPSPEDRPSYTEAEQMAQNEKRGIWKKSDNVAPWDWRKAQKRTARRRHTFFAITLCLIALILAAALLYQLFPGFNPF